MPATEIQCDYCNAITRHIGRVRESDVICRVCEMSGKHLEMQGELFELRGMVAQLQTAIKGMKKQS